MIARLIASSALVALFAFPALAAPADERRDELRQLREQIRQLEQDIARSEEARGDAADDLAQSEKAISSAQRRLHEIARERRAVEEEIRRLQAEQLELESRISERRKQLGDTVYRLYVEGGQAGARRLLGGGDPNQLARDSYYLEQIALQRAQMIEEARQALDSLHQVMAEAEQRRVELGKLEHERGTEQQRLADERGKHRAALDAAAGKLRAQRKEMQSLQSDAQRMEKLIKGLERIAKSRPPAKPPQVAKPTGPASEPVTGRADSVASSADAGNSISNLKGRLRWPIKGELTGRFGTPRGESGMPWKGVFIRATQGTEVHAVADGRVAYADWLRGFGNLIIVDHGGEYLSIYGSNDALLRTPGEHVRAGDVIATVGATGGAEESGLYFELRYRGQAVDPAKWMAGR